MISEPKAPPIIKISECKTEEQLAAALLYLQEITPTIPKKQLYNHQERIDAAIKRLDKMRGIIIETESIELRDKDRLFYYHKAIVLSVEFLKLQPNIDLLTQLFTCLKEALRVSGSEWNESTMYSDLIDFDKAYTKSEKKIYFIHKILQSGLHEKRSIVSIINMYLKLINILGLHEKINISLPSKKSLHNISFVDLKY